MTSGGGLYLSPPQRALVLSVDGKTSIQAKERKHPDKFLAFIADYDQMSKTAIPFKWTYTADPLVA